MPGYSRPTALWASRSHCWWSSSCAGSPGAHRPGSLEGTASQAPGGGADRPRPIVLESYGLGVTGLVGGEQELALADLPPQDELIATLDCTAGFYSTQRWRGNLLARVLEQASVDYRRARHVSVVSHTGYRWSFALEDASRLLLATH